VADFTAEQIETATNALLDYYVNVPEVRSLSIQDKPLLKALKGSPKVFPGGKDLISGAVKGVYDDYLQGFVNDDTVTYGNPANIRRYSYHWYLMHSGFQFSMHELAKEGISVTDSTTGENTTNHSNRDAILLAGILKDKIEDWMEGTERGENVMFWNDGTQDAKLIPGIRSFIVDNPTTATIVGGIDQAANDWWRNRASLLLNAGTPANGVVSRKLQQEWRQLRRYGGRPNLILCGSDFLDALERELKALGTYTQTGWASKGSIDMSIGDVNFKGTVFEYDPTLDDISRSKYCYVMDTRRIQYRPVDGESAKKHFPARPPEKYVFYRAQTTMAGLTCEDRRAQGVYSIA
jgi:hypothetical protein